ncbi:hypothetical protein BL250_12630 [Erwinia sp. OLTSP20]|nr:hypothetical protein BV501_09140 [Erwinia sp. OAMSP11]PIJ72070.1 hypothetical protein BK416_10040 [Erwinia sp. OLSSP12]PIJ81361.1 hypothetical protein BLD47_08865 [Erwinia sp. OLCASP19]PIJ84067.1 hypothetical protein BLD46_08445 [Erwinia sp. OLMTSP26]PIJ85766.1 hypothetical protein BLD49_09665 [Erwinia sp. OLMDSP33]PIJ91312.1 hypothetical protein BL250_12630 [Erwinia sp. OLTSP20]PIJ91955.1 hypothetical protein BL249_06805 [Erwinia sp. OLFS4]
MIMYNGIFAGTFSRDSEVTTDDGVKYWLVLNEDGDDYYEVRNKRQQKYVLLISTDSNVVSGISEDGGFSFPYPYKVYFLDDIPEDLKVGAFIYNGSEFKPFINVEVWKYNMNLQIKEAKLEALMNGEQRPDLDDKKKAVDAYVGDGYNPPLPF